MQRCNACGAESDRNAPLTGDGPGFTHAAGDCPRGGGTWVDGEPLSCVVKGCKIAIKRMKLPSAGHYADHMHWHQKEWEREDQRPTAAAPALAESVVFDEWWPAQIKVLAGARLVHDFAAPDPPASAVAILAFCQTPQQLQCLLVECQEKVIPMGAYQEYAGAYFGAAKIDPLRSKTIRLTLSCGTSALVRVGIRWKR